MLPVDHGPRIMKNVNVLFVSLVESTTLINISYQSSSFNVMTSVPVLLPTLVHVVLLSNLVKDAFSEVVKIKYCNLERSDRALFFIKRRKKK